MRVSISDKFRQRTARLATGLAIGALYFWLIGIGEVNRRFAWNSGLDEFYRLSSPGAIAGSDAVNGYYDLLGRSFASGELRLPVEPSPGLLALADPWSDRINRPHRLLDAVLYKGHYYLYHGPTPALLLFAPWYLITRHDLPENFAAFVLALGAYLFLSALFTRALSSLSVRLPLFVYTLFLVALGVAQSVPFLLHRVKVYEVAIACGYFCLSAGFYFLFRRLTDAGRPVFWSGLAGICFGLAVGSRPHLGLAAVPVFFLLLLRAPTLGLARRLIRRDVLAFTAPVILCGLGFLAYNTARFDNPMEFGTRYLVGGDPYRNFGVSTANIVRGLYYVLICPPDLVPEFPFTRLALRDPFSSSPIELSADYVIEPGYFLEPTSGALSICPLILLVAIVPISRRLLQKQQPVYELLLTMFVSVCGLVLVLAAVPFSSQRYQVDFLPLLLLISCVAAAALLGALRRNVFRILITGALVAILLYGIAANLGLGIQGPFDQFVQARPDSYVNLARWFSPLERFRPFLNPSVRARAVFEFPWPCPPRREPLLSTGEMGSRYLLSTECVAPGHIRLISQTGVRNPFALTVDLLLSPKGNEIALEFTPADRVMTVLWNRNIVLRHPLWFLVTANSQVQFGRDSTLGNQNVFDGRIISPRVGFQHF